MKRLFLSLVLFAAVAVMADGKVIAKGNSNTTLGNYTIELCDQPMVLAGEEMKCYLISYDNSPLRVKVYVDKERNCKNYVVVSDKLSVTYSCDGVIFGVKRLDEKFKSAGLTTEVENLDRVDYFHQKVLMVGPTQEFDATMLIASYFPQLIK